MSLGRSLLFKRLNSSFHKTVQPCIFVNDLNIPVSLGKNYWGVEPLYPLNYKLLIDLKLNNDKPLLKSGLNDDLDNSISYKDVAENVLTLVSKKQQFSNQIDLLNTIEDSLTSSQIPNLNESFVDEVKLTLDNDKYHMKLNSLQVEKISHLGHNKASAFKMKINELKLLTMIGIFDFERLQKQYVSINMTVHCESTSNENMSDDFNLFFKRLVHYVEHTEFLTVEALIVKIPIECSKQFKNDFTISDLEISKLNAILNARSVGLRTELLPEPSPVEISRNTVHTSDNDIDTSSWHDVYVAFGTNEGSDPISNIYKAIDHLEESSKIQLVQTSSIYETTPMYYSDQNNFLNGVLKLKTKLAPLQLLQYLKEIEYQKLHRVKKFNNGPRSIDLDIILYDNIKFEDPILTIPHTRMLERMFVLEPLLEVVDSKVNEQTLDKIKSSMYTLSKRNSEANICTIIPYVSTSKHKFDRIVISDKTFVMGIINMTKNSFSDGGKNFDLNDALNSIEHMIANNVHIIDIGATSTKPGVDIFRESNNEIKQSDIKKMQSQLAQDEIDRIVPLIKGIRAHKDEKIRNILISIDTFFSKTAEECLLAGANIINDVSLAMYDEKILSVIAKYKCPYIFNHTRGTPNNMKNFTKYDTYNSKNGIKNDIADPLIKNISEEMAICMAKAYNHGVKKWQLIADPGIGFAKTIQQNLQLVKSSKILRNSNVIFENGIHDIKDFNQTHGLYHDDSIFDYSDNELNITFDRLPVLIGVLKKRFLKSLDKNNKIETATLSMVRASIKGGSNFVRVHDVDMDI